MYFDMTGVGGGGGGRMFLTAVVAQGEAFEDVPGIGRVYGRSPNERVVSWTTAQWHHTTRSSMHKR